LSPCPLVSHSRSRAFTLLEVILAIGIMAIITMALFTCMHVAFKSRDAGEAALEPVRTSEAVMDLVRAELEAAQPPRGQLVGTFAGTSWQSGGGRDDDEISFYTNNPAPQGVLAPGEIKHVQLKLLTEEATGRRVLARRVTSNLLSPTLLEPDDEVLCRGVASFDVIYYDGTQWWTSWDSSLEKDSLPIAVQVTLELDPPTTGRNASNARGPKLARVIQLPCTGEGDPSEEEAPTDEGTGTGAPSESGGTPGGGQ
jgi:type II secretion system protein J